MTARRPETRLAALATAWRCLALLFALTAAGAAWAAPANPAWQAYQRNYYFQHLDDRNGLAQNSVSLIFQDQAGYMWFVTQGGLFRYDGYTLGRFTHDPERTDSLPGGYRAKALADAGNGLLWVGSASGGLALLDPAAKRTLPLPEAVRRPATPVNALLRLPDGGVLIGTSRGVDLLTGGANAPALHPLWRAPDTVRGELQSITRCPDGAAYADIGDTIVALGAAGSNPRVLATLPTTIDALYCDTTNRLLVGNSDGLMHIDGRTGEASRIWSDAPGTAVVAITADGSGRLWLALADHGLVRLSFGGDATRIDPAPAGIGGGLPDAVITTLYVDRTGLLWIGTVTSGVAWTRTDSAPIRAVLNLGNDARVRPYVRGFDTAGAGAYWVALEGPGLVRYVPDSATVTSHAAALEAAIQSPAARQARESDPLTRSARGHLPRWLGGMRVIWPATILPNPDGTLLLATNYGLLRFDPTSDTAAYLMLDGRPATFPSRAVLRDRHGDLWVAPFGVGLIHYHSRRTAQRFTAAQGIGSDTVLALAEDADGHIWAGTTDGVSMIDPATGKVDTFREAPGNPESLAGNTVASLLVDRGGTVWVGTLSGLNRLTHRDGGVAAFQRYGPRDGLPDTTVDCLLEDAEGHVWMSTNLGLAELNPATGGIRSFGPTDGTQGNEYNGGACGQAGHDRLLFGGHGFDIVDPARIAAPAPTTQVAITSIEAGSRVVAVPEPAAEVALAPDEHRLQVTFSAFDYAASSRSRYRYRLMGSGNPQWIGPTYEHRATWNELRPGSYRIEVQSLQRDGDPASTTELRVRVASAWWWSAPMRIVYAATLVLLILILLLAWRSHYLEQARHRRQLRLRENRLRQALWGSGDEFWDWNLATGTILRLGPEGAPGGHHEESIGADEWRTRMVHPDDLPAFNRALVEHLSGNAEHFEVEHRVRSRGGAWMWVISRGRVVERDAAGKPLRICGTERDISARRTADRDRRIAAEVIRNMSEAVAVTDLDFRFVSVNTAFTRMTGYVDQEVLGHDAAILNGSRHSPDGYSQVRQTLTETGHWRGELWQRRKDGEEFLCWVELNEVCDASGQRTHMIAVLNDITDRKRAEQELRYLANYDTLTGLPNRALLGERLAAAVINARRTGQKVGLLFLDLDRFKHINDSLGHGAGDRTLKATGARLRQYVRETDVVARLGGDEFTVVLESLADVRGAEEMAQRLIRAFARPLSISATQETVISPSIGIAVYPDHGQTPADLLKCADTAMYQAKERGRNTWAVYHAGMDTRARDHATLVTALRRALERHELRMVYQPKLAIRGAHVITGMEALLRWHHPELGEVSPSTFIPLAEETGQIHDISAFVFGTACADLRRFREHGHRHLTMAINLSPAQLNRPDLTAHICDMLAEHDVTPNQVELELTESMVMANAEQSVRLLGELKSIGARLAIDDFGTGYSSLAYLKRLPIDTLKIDQEFVGDITTDPDDAAITSTIITMAHSLQLRVVAEGVETEAQLAFLRTQGCDEIQGYWFAKPMTADDCLEFLNRHAAPALHPA